ncbi:MAG: carbon-nitrogen hydrolase family protein [Bacilli bacterium]|nr:carbon-nitrogen hydrolase family protein [Bacilli bacterium]MBN2877317.1 carbon-nitrogen hydrolase family protein [Bacilli bacterium]
MKIALIQNTVYDTVEQTLKGIDRLFKKLRSNPDFLVFPEMFTTPYDLSHMRLQSQKVNETILSYLKQLAISKRSYIISGSLPWKEDNKVFNRTYVINPLGETIAKYDKIHLFSIRYPDGTSFRENDLLTKGEESITFDTDFGRFGLMICFDIRYPELADRLAQAGAKAIFVPAAFNTYTGPMHWQTTFRSRAIDNQLFMIGCSPSRDSAGDYSVYGHSIVVGPLGDIRKELDEFEGILECDVDLNEVEHVRDILPILANK